MNAWFQFLFGTPRRTITTVGIAFFVMILIYPPLLGMMAMRIMTAVEPLIVPVFLVGLCWAGIRFMFRGFSK